MKNLPWIKMSGPLVILFGCQETVTPPPSEKSVVKANATVNGIPEAVQRVREASGRDKPVVCGTYEVKDGDETITEKEIMRMGVINAKLSLLPEAKLALGFSEVKTCEQARAFIEHMRNNPGLEALFEIPETPHAVRVHPISRDSAEMQQSQVKPAPLEKANIRNAAGSENRQGVVQITGINGESIGCTGYMITLNAIVTAAHCLYGIVTSEDHAYVSNIFIEYFDPNSSNSPSAPRDIAFGTSGEVWIAPTYAGGLDAESDIAIIRSNTSWYDITIYDLVRIYNDTFSDARYNYLYGRGVDGYSGYGAGTLRFEYMYIESYGAYAYYTEAYNHRVCRGDSGGPQFREGGNFTLGHASWFEKAYTGSQLCAKQGGKEWSTRLSSKVDWIEDVLDTDCYYLTGYADPVDYRQCFATW
jgi:V8-like Glu-specific endopeptidase